MMTISGRHIRKAMVDRRRRNSRNFSVTDDRAPEARSPGDQVWTVSAISRANPFGSASHRVSHGPAPQGRPVLLGKLQCLSAQSTFELVLRPLDHVFEFLVALSKLCDHHGIDGLIIDLGAYLGARWSARNRCLFITAR